jgi:enoyl-CoA hydratase
VNQDILFDVQSGVDGNVGVITLNRSKALNALTLSMFEQLSEKMIAWESDASIKAVIIKSSSTRAFCAGGDIRYIYQERVDLSAQPHPFFQIEYQFNQFLHHFKKPYIALCDGITMGGGVGVSIHGSHRVATPNMIWSMPETKIGFFPDVGVSYYLAKCSDYVGYYLALSGRSINAYTAKELGLVDVVVASECLESLESDLVNMEWSDDFLNRVSNLVESYEDANEGDIELQEYFPVIRRCFSQDSVSSIFDALEFEGSDWAISLLEELKQRSPTSLNIAYHQLNRVVGMTLDDVMQQDAVLANHFLQGHDFFEGARALIVEKDNTPAWRPDSIGDVTERMVQAYFS